MINEANKSSSARILCIQYNVETVAPPKLLLSGSIIGDCDLSTNAASFMSFSVRPVPRCARCPSPIDNSVGVELVSQTTLTLLPFFLLLLPFGLRIAKANSCPFGWLPCRQHPFLCRQSSYKGFHWFCLFGLGNEEP